MVFCLASLVFLHGIVFFIQSIVFENNNMLYDDWWVLFERILHIAMKYSDI